MRIAVVSLFPQMIHDALAHGVVGRALERGGVEVECVDPREFTQDVHRSVDDRPYGGGPGMILKLDPLQAAVHAAADRLPQGSKRVYLGADGEPFDQRRAREALGLPGLLLVAGRYEGIDERFIATEIDETWSIGDYIVSGGELPALVVIDAIARLVPGTLGSSESAVHYTRPPTHAAGAVPEVLIGGDHAAIRRWRLREALGRTWLRRPAMLERRGLNAEERTLLEEFKKERAARSAQSEDKS
jgi:tRNA (guanine37-N1)-methyltransferase